MRLNITTVFACLFLLAGCTEAQLAAHVVKQFPGTPAKSQGTFKVGNPYDIYGVTYTPRETYNFTETGIASWYGPQFHGKHTANGEIFDMNELTAAHRTLQLPSFVRVTNLENGRSLIVRVNDRGPYKRGRVMDLSKRAAELLGYKDKGTAKVKLQVLTQESKAIAEIAKRGEDTRGFEVALNEDRASGRAVLNQRAGFTQEPYKVASAEPQQVEDAQTRVGMQPVYDYPPGEGIAPEPVMQTPLEPPPTHAISENIVKTVAVPDTSIYVQAGSFSNEANAARLAEAFTAQGRPADVYPAVVNGKQFYRVRLGPLETVDHADSLLLNLNNSGHPEAMIIVQ